MFKRSDPGQFLKKQKILSEKSDSCPVEWRQRETRARGGLKLRLQLSAVNSAMAAADLWSSCHPVDQNNFIYMCKLHKANRAANTHKKGHVQFDLCCCELLV